MYKVFINHKVICFTNNHEIDNEYSHRLLLNFFHAEISLLIVDLLYSDKKLETIIVCVADYQKAFSEFQSQFKLIKAAGGIVNNQTGEKLFIYRLDKWDLPKGKIEKNEEIEAAALREIKEECGISDLIINKPLKDTFHIYQLKDKLILKQTYWFDVSSSYKGNLTPQLEENITQVEWLTDEQIKNKVVKNTYVSIMELLGSINLV